MITLKSVHLSNFCQYENFQMEFQKGMVAVLGPNGVGKSNLFRGIIYALTGWCDQQWGTQTQMQKDDATLPGYAEIAFAVDIVEYTIKRFTATGAKYNDTLTSTNISVVKRQKVNEALEALFGMPLNLLAQLLWVRQEAASWLLTSPPAVINTFLGQLFDMKKVEKARDALKQAADSVAHLRSDFLARQQEAEQRLKDLVSEEELKKRLEVSKEKLSKIKEKQSKLQSTDGLYTEEQLEIEITAAEAKLQARLDAKPKAPEVLDKPEIFSENCNYSELLDQEYAKMDSTRNKIHSLENAIAEHNCSLEELKEHQLKANSIAEVSCCELCGSHLDDKKQYSKAKMKLLLGSDLDVDIYKITIQEKIKQVTESRDSMIAAYEKLQQEFQAIQENRELYVQCYSYADYLKRLALYNKELAIWEQEVKEATQELEKLKTTEAVPDDMEQLKRKVDRAVTMLEEEVSGLEDGIASSKATRQILENDIAQCKQEAIDYKKNEGIRALLTKARAVLSQQRAQTRYIAGKLIQVNASIADTLLRLELPFSLEIDLSEHFFKYKNNGSDIWKAASTLSGAQKAMASVALQLALIEMLHPEVKLLLLDEADAALSVDNKTKLSGIINPMIAENILLISQSENIINECHGALTLT